MMLTLAITGPTGAGKTALSLEVAKALHAEILSLDSMQVYRRMDVGTAKATASEQAAAPHHLIDIREPGERFSVHDYESEALSVLDMLKKKNRRALFVGGTGLYLENLKRVMPPDVPESAPDLLTSLKARFHTEDGELDRDALWEHLCAIDPESAEKTHKNNLRRVARAIEIYETTGRTKSELDRLSTELSPRLAVAHLTLDFHQRDTLYDRIDRRVEQMIEEGLIEELSRLYEDGVFHRDSTARQAIGYKELLPFIEDGVPLETCVEELKRATRRYAKRQLTWFRHLDGVYTLYLDNEDGTVRPHKDVFSEALEYFKSKLDEFEN